MKYDVKRYSSSVVAGAFGDVPCYLVVDENGKPIHVLPKKCESVEMGLDWCAWMETKYNAHMGTRWLSGFFLSTLQNDFAEFLKSRESDDDSPDTDIKAGRVSKHKSVDEMIDSLKQPLAETEEATGESEYHIWGHTPSNTDDLDVTSWVIEHVKSSNFVPLTFASLEDAEGFLRWWFTSNTRDNLTGTKIHEGNLKWLENEFKRYEAEQEPEFVCPECGSKAMSFETTCDNEFLACTDEYCCARSGSYPKDGQPDESWIRKEPA